MLSKIQKLADERGQNLSECMRDVIEAGMKRLLKKNDYHKR